MKSDRVLDVIGTLARLGLAAVWLISGVLKVIDPDQTYIAVRAYDVLPDPVVEVIAALLPWVEIALGVLLLAGNGVRVVALLSVALLLVFVAGVAQAWARGLSIDCGCFGGGGAVEPGATTYVQELLRDGGFLLLAGWLLVRPRSFWALDARLANTGRT
ncbi:MauE/DoxX family redox-associated membrane protein [Pseudonocardia nigra]|uniref:MauE/DoxX family redox-associated membrane protein n=1 Tax=Pseudonocardia nigra TaxID=1921578 RepID=UPI001C5EF16A|nr:MauE/DoxX family redox-associated membrane protein [Pseudonocardia nigra]